jgi:RsiW-degrading membrane proteinase PrsW (M82 family)
MIIVVLLINILVAFVWIKIVHKLDTYKRFKHRKQRVYLRFFILGMVSVIPTLILYELFHPVYHTVYYTATKSYYLRMFIYAFLFNGPIEEFSKFIVFFLAAYHANTVREPQDGVLQAATTALGFAFVENLFYSSWYGMEVLLFRSIINIPGHMIYTSIIGAVAAVYLIERKTVQNSKAWHNIVIFLFLAGFIHGAWNFFLDIHQGIYAYMIKFLSLLLFIRIYSDLKKKSPFIPYPSVNYKKAIAELSAWLERTPDNHILHKRLAHYHLYAGNYAEAEEHLKKYRKHAPRDVVAKYYLGVIAILLGDVDKGEQLTIEALSRLPKDKQKQLNRSLKKNLRYKRDRDRVRDVLDLSPV